MGRVDGKIAIVTGAASGMGRVTAGLLVREGARVVATDVNESGGEALAKELGPACSFEPQDVSREADWERVVAATRERHGALHVLVNNAGIVSVATVEDTSVEELRRVLAVNLEGVFLGCKHAIPLLAASGGGSIVNLSSVAGIAGTPPFAAYSASKGGVRALTKTVAAHCAQRGYGIRCNSIHPGGIDTPMLQGLPAAAAGATPVTLEALAKTNAGGTPPGAPDDVAQLVLYLASDESRYMTGAELVIDGGLLAT